MLKNGVIAMWLLMIGSAFWIPSEVYAVQIYTDPKTGKSCDCDKSTSRAACSFCLSTGSTVAEGFGNTQGATTSVFVAIKPDPNTPVFLICRNRGGETGSGQAFLPFVSVVTGAVTNESVGKKGNFTFVTGHIVPTGIHPEYTPEQCSADPACAQIQQFCPNGVITGNEGKNWVPIDLTPIKTLAQDFLYYCGKETNKRCPCDPRKDAGADPNGAPILGQVIDGTLGPADRCASNTTTPPGGSNTFTFAWTNTNGDGYVDHLDIVPADLSPVFECTLPHPEDYFFGASLPYDCVTKDVPNLFP